MTSFDVENGGGTTGEFRYLLVPENWLAPIEELILSKSGGLEKDALRLQAEDRFLPGFVNRQSQREATAMHLSSQGMSTEKVSEIMSSLDGVSSASSVEIITVTLPTKKNGLIGVS